MFNTNILANSNSENKEEKIKDNYEYNTANLVKKYCYFAEIKN